MAFEKGTLWQTIIRTADHALRVGALVPIETDYAFIDDHGVRFSVRVLAALKRKDEEKKKQERSPEKRANPFLPPERDLLVAGVSDAHAAILNKYNVVEHHLLIVTRHFEDQETLMTLVDFEALWLCMAEYNALVFYTGGRDGGASQGHKHIQMVPLPLAPEGPAVPVAPLLAGVTWENGIGTVAAFPFLHAFVRLDPELAKMPREAAIASFELYRNMLRSLGMEAPDRGELKTQSVPYCLLVTREWMLLVPRSREHFEDISLNSLAYAGSLFVRDERQLDRLREYGPMNALATVALPRKGQ
jgi:ATP adenylyltransferase